MSPSFSPRYSRLSAPIAALAVVVFLSGCAHTYTVKVDALANPRIASGHSFRIEPKDAFTAERDPTFPAATALVRTALETRGMYEADNPKDADVVVTVDYGIGARRMKLDPVPTPHVGTSVVLSGHPGTTPRNSRNTAPSDLSLNPTQVVEPALPAQANVVRVVAVFEKFLELSARESEKSARGSHASAELWRVTATVEDEETEVAQTLPILAGVAAEKIGTTTENREQVRVTEKDAIILVSRNDG